MDKLTIAPKPQEGTWILKAPNGRYWKGHSPLNCVKNELHERVPLNVRMERINSFLFDDAESDKEFNEWWRASEYASDNEDAVDCRGIKEIAEHAWKAARI